MNYQDRDHELIFPKDINYFTELDVNHTITISKERRNISKIISVKSNIQVVDSEVLRTPIMVSNNGEKLTGCKLSVEIRINELISYMSKEELTTLEVVRSKVAKNIFITIPKMYGDQNAIDLLRKRKIKVEPYIEDVYANMLDSRNINVNNAIFINVVILED